MPPRSDFLRVLSRNRRAMDAERREFAERAVAILKRNMVRQERFTLVTYSLTMIELDPLLTEFYGAFPGDFRGQFGRLMLEECRAARGLAFQRAVQDVRRQLTGEPTTLNAIEREAV